MVGRLLTLFQRVFHVFMFFEEYFLRLGSWNTLLLSYKLLETYLKPDLGIDVAYIDDLFCNKYLHQG